MYLFLAVFSILSLGFPFLINGKPLEAPPTVYLRQFGNHSWDQTINSCPFVISAIGDTSGKGAVYLSYAWTQGEGTLLQCNLNYGYHPFTFAILSVDSTGKIIQEQDQSDLFTQGYTYYAFRMNNTAYFPARFGVLTQSTLSVNLSLGVVGTNMPYGSEYDYSLLTGDEISNTIFYTYYFNWGECGIIQYSLSDSAYSRVPSGGYTPMRRLLITPGASIVSYVEQKGRFIVNTRNGSDWLQSVTDPLADLTKNNPGLALYDAIASGEDKKAFVLLGTKSMKVVAVIDLATGKLSTTVNVNVNATLLVNGFRDFVAVAGPYLAELYQVEQEGVTWNLLSSVQLDFVGHYWVSSFPPPVSGSFSVGYKDDSQAMLWLLCQGQYTYWLRSLQILVKN